MKRSFFAVLFVLLALTACQRDDTFEPVAELPFATHPSVLRGNWTGTLFGSSTNQDVLLELTDLVAECVEHDEDACDTYTFEGGISITGSAPVSITGKGYAGSYIYTLTSPTRPMPPLVEASFEFDGATWLLTADYLSDLPSADEAIYGGSISADRGSRIELRLEPTP